MAENTQPVVSSFKTKTKKHNVYNKYIILGIFLIGIALIVTIVVSFLPQKKPISFVCSNSSNDYILKDAASAFATNNLSEQSTLAGKITNLTNYKEDPNCMYVLTRSYIDDGNLTAANTSLNQLKKVYNPKIGYNGLLYPALTFNELQSVMLTIETNQNNKAHVTYLHEPGKNN